MAIPSKEEAIELFELKPIYYGAIELSGRELNQWKGREQFLTLQNCFFFFSLTWTRFFGYDKKWHILIQVNGPM
jgi:hypothetical protein